MQKRLFCCRYFFSSQNDRFALIFVGHIKNALNKIFEKFAIFWHNVNGRENSDFEKLENSRILEFFVSVDSGAFASLSILKIDKSVNFKLYFWVY